MFTYIIDVNKHSAASQSVTEQTYTGNGKLFFASTYPEVYIIDCKV